MPKKDQDINKTNRMRVNDTPPRKQSPATLLAVNEKNIGIIEQETIERVNKTLSALEVAIATWGASDKPEEKKEKFMRYKWFHDALAEWEKKELLSMGKDDFQNRLYRLQEFANICHAYAAG